jgi:phytoene/squalene synthetase
VSREAVAAQVEKGDPDRWRTAMTASPDKRAGLMALYAFNLEIARAPWVASEEMIAQIRLRWWMDAIEEAVSGAPVRRHEVAEPLAEAIRAAALPQNLFDEMIAARLTDASPAPHADGASLARYIERTSAHLMELAARHLGAPEAALPAVRKFGYGAGVAGLLRALPELRARGRDPLPPSTDLAALARDGLAAIAAARAKRALVPPEILPALLPGWLAELRLKRAVADPESIPTVGLEVSEFRARAALLRTALTGRW